MTTGALAVLAGLLLLPAVGRAATEFGDPLNNEPSEVKCLVLGPCTIVGYTSPSPPEGNPNSEGAPFDGVITKFRYFAYSYEEPGQITFGVATIAQQDPDNALATAAGTGPTVTLPAIGEDEPSIGEVGARVPVKKGQHLAVSITKSIAIIYNPDGCKYSYVFAPPLIEGAGQRGSTEPACRLTVAARIEPDADGDGFGDETQDQCPTQKSTQGPCDTTSPTVSGLKVKGSKVSYSLSEASTVVLQLEKKAKGRKVGGKCVKQTTKNKKKKSCPLFKKIGASFNGPGAQGANTVTLPNGKKLKPGTYRLTMTATDAVGNPTTTTTTFKVVKKKKKKKHH
jgi:hypothetical protein